MKIIIAGCRDITDYEHVRKAMIESGYWRLYKHNIEVVCGMARGVDLLGKKFAKRNGLVCHEFPADWNKHGKAAGHIRNVEMGKFAKAHDGLLLAIWDGVSPGTKHMIKWARDNGLKGYVYRTDKNARSAKIGARVRTDFSCKWTEHVITARMTDCPTQSRVTFQVEPAVPKSSGLGAWLDADWFELLEDE